MKSLYSAKQIELWLLSRRARLNTPKLLALMYFEYGWSLIMLNPNQNKITTNLFPAHINPLPHIPADLRIKENLEIHYGTDLIPHHNYFLKTTDYSLYKNLSLIYRMYVYYSVPQLEHLIHKSSPWQKARKGLTNDSISPQRQINNKDLYQFYRNKLQK